MAHISGRRLGPSEAAEKKDLAMLRHAGQIFPDEKRQIWLKGKLRAEFTL
jgi:hypothetical protein